jgi:hypothetical protein
MNTTRSVRPTDLVALVSLDGRVYLNEAWTWERLGDRSDRSGLFDSGIGSLISFAARRRTWVTVQGQTIRGLVSVRPRAGRGTWEIDRLVVSTEDEFRVAELFERVSSAAARAGVGRIFLRLETGSDCSGPARRAGFAAYLQENLLRADGALLGEPLPDGLLVDAYQSADAFSLYRLYNAAAPEGVRRVEAPTFQQWMAAEECSGCGRSSCDYVVRRGSEAMARLQAARSRGVVRMEISANPAADHVVPGLVDLASAFAETKRPLYCLVPSYAGGVEHCLRQTGFALDSQYVVYMKRTTLPIPVAKPSRARLAVPNPIAAV